jgi:hypothetical protein
MVLTFKRNFVQRSNPNLHRFILTGDGTWVLKKNVQRSVSYWKKVEEEENNSTKKINKRKNGEYDKDSPPSKTSRL